MLGWIIGEMAAANISTSFADKLCIRERP